mgnify:CR=1 FL=1
MKYLLLVFTLTFSQIFAEVSMRPNEEATILPIEPTHPIVRPPKPIRPKEKYLLMHQDNYYTTNIVSTCDQYIKLIEEKDKEIAALKKEIESLRKKEHSKMQKNLKKAYEKEMQKFENRGKNTPSKSKAVISETY